jgi:drug/metabolite transporter (DMT)-like permease
LKDLKQRDMARALILAVLSAALFGAATPASKALLDGMGPLQLAGLLYLGAAAGVAPFALRRGGLGLPARSDRRNRLRLGGAILAGGILGPVLLLAGLRLTDAASVALWLNFELAATALLGAFVFREHIGRAGWAGVGVAIAGAIVLSSPSGFAGAAAAALVLAACLCWGLDNHLTALIDGITPSQSTFWKGLVAGTTNLVLGLALEPFTAGAGSIATALAVGALSYGASIVLYIHAAQALGATRAQGIFASAPFFGVALAVAFLGESLREAHLIAALLFLAAIVLLSRDRHSHRHAHEAMEHAHEHRHDDGHHAHAHPGLRAEERHSHRHRHEPVVHAHPHWPDLHHRHRH